MSVYANCGFCRGQGRGCLSCDAERERDQSQFHGPKDPGTINVHLNDVRDAEAVRLQLIRRTGQEPLICLHLYADSIDDLRRQLGVRMEDSKRRSNLEMLLENRALTDDIAALGESEELQEARRQLIAWSAHSTSYASERRTHFQREILRLEAERDAPPVPDDHTEDACAEEDTDDEQNQKPKSPPRGTKRRLVT